MIIEGTNIADVELITWQPAIHVYDGRFSGNNIAEFVALGSR